MDQNSRNSEQHWDPDRHSKIMPKKIPLGAWVLSYFGVFNLLPAKRYYRTTDLQY